MAGPVIIGVTGGIGAGKSTLVDALARRGAVPFSADEAVHELYRTPEVRDAVRERWGADVLGADGGVDRGAIAEIVFRDEDERRWLEGLLHPLVARSWLRFVHEHETADAEPEFLVAEVPLLFEAGLEDRYDAIVAIVAPLDTRLERAEARGRGRSLAGERAAAQMPDAEKSDRADFTFDNSGTREQLDAFAADVLETLRSRRRAAAR